MYIQLLLLEKVGILFHSSLCELSVNTLFKLLKQVNINQNKLVR